MNYLLTTPSFYILLFILDQAKSRVSSALERKSCMKCYTHPTEESVGICSKCGKAICSKCLEMTFRKLVCKECLQINVNSPRPKPYAPIGAFLGVFGAFNSLILGFYIVSTGLSPVLLADFLHTSYIAGALTLLCSVMLVYGSYLMWKGQATNGGRINLIAGVTLALIYAYFAFFSKPQILSWLGPAGYLLLVPPLLSSIIASIQEPFHRPKLQTLNLK